MDNEGSQYDVEDIIVNMQPNDKFQQPQFKRPKNDHRDSNYNNRLQNSQSASSLNRSRDQQPPYMKNQGGFVPNNITTPMILAPNMIEVGQTFSLIDNIFSHSTSLLTFFLSFINSHSFLLALDV